MPTATIPVSKPPRPKTRLINPCAQLEPEPKPGSYDVFYGPFDSWLNVKNPPAALLAFMPAAVGDGIADDTSALQAALDFCGKPYYGSPVPESGLDASIDPGWRSFAGGSPKSSGSMGGWNGPDTACVYLPAGTYRVTRTLIFGNRLQARIVGEDPQTTSILWDGYDWQSNNGGDWDFYPCQGVNADNAYCNGTPANLDVILLDGVAECEWGRITVDGGNKARAALAIIGTGKYIPAGSSLCEFRDLHLRNCAYGMPIGGPAGGNDDTSLVKRVWFSNIVRDGLRTMHYNALNWQMWECIFDHCGRGLVEYGGLFNAYNCLFINSHWVDVLGTSHALGVRGCVSVTTVDASIDTSGAYEFFPFAFYSQGSAINVTIQGNLVISSVFRTLIEGSLGPSSYIDNAVYDGNHPSSGSSTPVVFPQMWYAAYVDNLDTGQAKGDIPSSLLLSGNTYNGQVIAGPSDTQANPYIVVDTSRPAGWTPPNNLGVTESELSQLLTATSASPLIQELRDRMPHAPIRLDPYSSPDVQLTDFLSADPKTVQDIGSGVANAVQGGSPGKLNLIHISSAGATFDPITIPPHLPIMILGDGVGTVVGSTLGASDSTPLITTTGGAVKLWLGCLHIWDMYNRGDGRLITDEPSVIHIQSADNGRVYVDDLFIKSPGSDNPSGLSSSGFANLKVRIDNIWCGTVEAVGVGTPPVISSAADFQTTVNGLWVAGYGAVDRWTPYYVSGQGSLRVVDIYAESQARLIDLRGGSGYFFLDGQIKQQISNADVPADAINHLTDFNGTILVHNVWTWQGIVAVDIPASNSRTCLYAYSTLGLVSYHDPAAPWRDAIADAFVNTGATNTWTPETIVPVAKVVGLTDNEAANLPANLRVGNVGWTFGASQDASGTLVDAITDLGVDDGSGNLVTGPITITGFLGAHPWGGGTYIEIDLESMELVYRASLDTGTGESTWYVYRGLNGTSPALHAAGSTITGWAWDGISVRGKNLPEPFIMPDYARQVLQYKPFPSPTQMSNPNASDIVLQRVILTSNRLFTLKIEKAT